MLREQSESSPRIAAEIDRARVDGDHYLELIEPIKQAKRDGDNEHALELCYQAIQAAEQARPRPEDRSDGYRDLIARGVIKDTPIDEGWSPPPAYTKHAAIVLRKLGRRDEEIAVLERYLQHLPPEDRASHEFTERIHKVKQMK